jgi:hypothetical protein
MKIPNPKIQNPKQISNLKNQISNSKFHSSDVRTRWRWDLRFGAWDLVGNWDLDLGISTGF